MTRGFGPGRISTSRVARRGCACRRPEQADRAIHAHGGGEPRGQRIERDDGARDVKVTRAVCVEIAGIREHRRREPIVSRLVRRTASCAARITVVRSELERTAEFVERETRFAGVDEAGADADGQPGRPGWSPARRPTRTSHASGRHAGAGTSRALRAPVVAHRLPATAHTARSGDTAPPSRHRPGRPPAGPIRGSPLADPALPTAAGGGRVPPRRVAPGHAAPGRR